MNQGDKKQFTTVLSAHVDSINKIDIDETDVQAAQQKLNSAIEQLPPRRKRLARRWLFAATTACAIAVISLLPIFGGNNGVAFAQVQKHFVDFQTMVFTVEQRVSGQLVQSTLVQMNRAGDVRTDVDSGVSVVVSPAHGQVLTLMHETREAMQFPIGTASAEKNEATDFLRDVQEYKKKAKPLHNSRIIDGKKAIGWELEIVGMHTEIWADSDGVPMLMTMKTGLDGKSLDLAFHFKFNQPIAESTFSTSIPASYTLVKPDQ